MLKTKRLVSDFNSVNELYSRSSHRRHVHAPLKYKYICVYISVCLFVHIKICNTCTHTYIHKNTYIEVRAHTTPYTNISSKFKLVQKLRAIAFDSYV